MKKFLWGTILIIILFFAGWVYWKFYFTYSDGNRSGLLQKFSRRGYIFKTYEGELLLNSFVVNGTAPLSSEKFLFSVADKKLGEKMNTFEGKKVVLHYNQKNGALPWRGDTEYIVDSVELQP
jgi:hypothetical protein